MLVVDITTECFKEADKELIKGFVDKYLKKATEQDIQDVDSDIIIRMFQRSRQRVKKGFCG